MYTIVRFNAAQVAERLEEFIALLQNVVDDGASIGFLPPLSAEEAAHYWRGVIRLLEQTPQILLAALEDDRVVGSIQLEPCMKKNGSHRAEIQKLMVHTAARRKGIARALLEAIEEQARQLGRELLVLDTREGDVAEQLYQSAGYKVAGVIPQYARSANGQLDGSVFYYKKFD
jgi:Acetyltransferases